MEINTTTNEQNDVYSGSNYSLCFHLDYINRKIVTKSTTTKENALIEAHSILVRDLLNSQANLHFLLSKNLFDFLLRLSWDQLRLDWLIFALNLRYSFLIIILLWRPIHLLDVTGNNRIRKSISNHIESQWVHLKSSHNDRCSRFSKEEKKYSFNCLQNFWSSTIMPLVNRIKFPELFLSQRRRYLFVVVDWLIQIDDRERRIQPDEERSFSSCVLSVRSSCVKNKKWLVSFSWILICFSSSFVCADGNRTIIECRSIESVVRN